MTQKEKSEFTLNECPKLGDWQLHVFPKTPELMKFIPKENGAPNWFHRKMQEIFFGVKWVKREKK